jgi:hypothetical protein
VGYCRQNAGTAVTSYARAVLPAGDDVFTTDDLADLSDVVSAAWRSAACLDWSVPAGTLDWSCGKTADHAVDCVYAPAFFLASRRQDGYPEVGADLTVGENAPTALLLESLAIATRLLVAVIHDTAPDVRAVIFRGPEVTLAPPADFAPRAALELILHAHDVCTGLGVGFEPPAPLCRRLGDHTRHWPLWELVWNGLDRTDDPWGDLLRGSGRRMG